MARKIFLVVADVRHECTEPPAARGLFVEVPGQQCPHAGEHAPQPGCTSAFWIRGYNRRFSDDDQAYEADAACAVCGNHVGLLRVEVDTLFGVREDHAVLNGRCRVY
jgi:hypothetical protein